MVSMNAVVAIVLSVAVDVAGGSRCATCVYCGTRTYVDVVAAVRVVVVHVVPCCGRCTCRCRPRCPLGEAAAACVIPLLLVAGWFCSCDREFGCVTNNLAEG